MEKIPIVTEFVSALRVQNSVNFRMESKARFSAAYIFPLCGEIKFTQKGHCVIADRKAPVYIPAGAAYVNECLVDAESIVFNINDTNDSDVIRSLFPMNEDRLIRIYNRICVLKAMTTGNAQAETFSLLYRVISESITEQKDKEKELIDPAIETIELRLNDSHLNMEELAQSCHVSKTYLNKLFSEAVGMSPFRYLTLVRMEHARYMLRERYPVGEVARSVGYSDIYQFSRAYKRYYGVSPRSHMEEK